MKEEGDKEHGLTDSLERMLDLVEADEDETSRYEGGEAIEEEEEETAEDCGLERE